MANTFCTFDTIKETCLPDNSQCCTSWTVTEFADDLSDNAKAEVMAEFGFAKVGDVSKMGICETADEGVSRRTTAKAYTGVMVSIECMTESMSGAAKLAGSAVALLMMAAY